jgi:predicted ABC-type ATPase
MLPPALHELIYKVLEPELEAFWQELLAALPRQTEEKPRFIHMCGIPGSGKTTYTKYRLAQNPNFSLVQFDSIMESLPGYQPMLEELGPKRAFAHYELPARTIGYRLLSALVQRRHHIFFDHSAANRTHLGLLQALKTQGYQVEMHYLECHPHEAIQRVQKRFSESVGRHTPEELIWERAALLEELLPLYRELVHVHSVAPLAPVKSDMSCIQTTS